jgi:hypothetical protein
LDRNRGTLVVDSLDSHRDLLRLKLAALLAMLEHCPDLEKTGEIVAAVKLARAAIERAA